MCKLVLLSKHYHDWAVDSIKQIRQDARQNSLMCKLDVLLSKPYHDWVHQLYLIILKENRSGRNIDQYLVVI